MPAHRLGAHPGLSEQRECTQTRSQQQNTRTSYDGTHLAPACTHPFMSVHPLSSTRHTCTHTPRHTVLHTRLERPSSRTPRGTQRHTRAWVCSHLHPYPSGLQQGPPLALSMRAQCQQRGTATLSLSTAQCGTRTVLWQVHTNPPRGAGKRAVPPHWCQRRCPHSAATASDSGSGSERTGCECATGGGDGRALGALGARWHSPGQLPAHPTSAERIN